MVFITSWIDTHYGVAQCWSSSDFETTKSILSVIQHLHQEDGGDDYCIDMGTLESISMEAARKNVDVTLLVFDLVEQFGHDPTASLYEDVILSFAATSQDENMLAALADMHKFGFVPSVALLRYVARKLAHYEKRMEHSFKVLTWRDNQHIRSVHGMNVLLHSYGINRDLNNAFYVFEELPRFDLKPDANTFAFLMEALYVDIKSKSSYNPNLAQGNAPDMNDFIGASQIIIDAMEEAGVEKTMHVYSEHIRLLCTFGMLDDAKRLLEEAIATETPVPKGAIFLLGTKFVESGDFDSARAVAGLSVAAGCGEFPKLANIINKAEGGTRRNKSK